MKEKQVKRILFIGYNFSPELTGIGKYSGEMMHWLAQQGHHCTVLTAYPYYPYWKIQEPYRKNRFWYRSEVEHFSSGGKLTVLRCPMYVPEQPSGIKRMLLDTSFSFTSLCRMLPLLFQKKHDWVISIAPSFQFGILGVLYKKLRGGKHLHHIQDLQIEAAQDLGLIKSKTLLKLLYGTERFIFKHTDVVSSISDGMISRIEKKALKPLLFFPNWTETNSFYPILEDHGALKEKFGYAPTDWVVLYSGAIGEKQGLESILHTAKTLHSHEHLKFAICGTGPYKETLKDMATNMELKNVRFLPLQPKADFNAFLNMADLHLVIQKEKASDLVMPSKLTTILAVGGLALITANEQSSLHKVVRKYEMGLLVAAENQQALNDGILNAFQSKEKVLIKKAARTYAEEYLAIDTIMNAFEKELNIE
ncbi:colanic acid biosynthesis glycosyltransferase WcaI [Zobellia amurskyensis]|uniref:Colanic acid biosynthesis glycosyltransferase WcaI n=1 Tax=Zobellia amurskyensis TaxID=248905 RepID=A0A7X3D0Y6_9FLAO|nr:WcaI family glycosyltransferase [Zobellia amurskyensis]MUH35599.1 colanic acid biosynthesis glycosyltransferase WcaI [Zobellia amurskyensis]